MTRRWLALGAILVLPSLAAACSDDASVTVATSPNTTAAPPTTAAASSATTAVVPDTSAAPVVDPVKGNPIDPCSLLTVDEIGSALQVPVSAPTPGPQSNLPNPLGQRTCTWTTTESPPRSVAVSVVTTQSAQLGGAAGGTYTAHQLFEDTKPLAEGVEPIPGLGDDAFFGAVAGMQVTVVKGDVYFSVTVPFGTTDADAAIVRALAPLAVARLP
ncbi:MAG TPA: DUF3558 family protein [Acidimicrobiales bacterium]|nr:DUF3558 family protein [Acidimicrobiales bacterium]